MFFSIAVVGITAVLHPFATFQFDPFAHEGAAAVLTAEQAAVPEHTPVCPRPDIPLFSLPEKCLGLLPDLPGHNGREVVLVPELLRRLGEAEGLVDLVALALVADQGADVTLIP